MALEIENLRVGYGSSEVLHGVSLGVNGDSVAVLGANGAGKSTLLRAISGLLRPAAGAIRFDGQLLNGLSPERIVALGISHVPQGRRIFTSLTVRENLTLATFTIGDRREGRRRIDEIWSLFPRLRVAESRKGSALSGGEQQMLAIARGLVMPSRLLMLDEPSIGLAPRLIEDVASTLANVRDHFHVAVLIVEQNPWLAHTVAERCVVLSGGRVVASGPMDEFDLGTRLQDLYLRGEEDVAAEGMEEANGS